MALSCQIINDFENIRKEAEVAKFQDKSWHLFRLTEESLDIAKPEYFQFISGHRFKPSISMVQ
jgi:ubiquitin C-terminal hydrolase